MKTQESYSIIATAYHEQFGSALADRPLDRAMLSGFADMVRSVSEDPRVLEVGSGPGYVSAFLHERGLDIHGSDLSSGMVELARSIYPHIDFEVGDMRKVKHDDASLSGLVAWYSIIHLQPDELSAVFEEFARVLQAGGYLLLAFQAGDEVLHLDHAFGHEVSLDFQRFQPEAVALKLSHADFEVVAKLVQAPDPTCIAEKIPQAIVVARRL